MMGLDPPFTLTSRSFVEAEPPAAVQADDRGLRLKTVGSLLSVSKSLV